MKGLSLSQVLHIVTDNYAGSLCTSGLIMIYMVPNDGVDLFTLFWFAFKIGDATEA